MLIFIRNGLWLLRFYHKLTTELKTASVFLLTARTNKFAIQNSLMSIIIGKNERFINAGQPEKRKKYFEANCFC